MAIGVNSVLARSRLVPAMAICGPQLPLQIPERFPGREPSDQPHERRKEGSPATRKEIQPESDLCVVSVFCQDITIPELDPTHLPFHRQAMVRLVFDDLVVDTDPDPSHVAQQAVGPRTHTAKRAGGGLLEGYHIRDKA